MKFKFPFRLNPSIGLAIHKDVVRIVLLEKGFGRIFLMGWDEESVPATEDPRVAKIEAIAKLFDRIPVPSKEVAVYCENKSVRFLFTTIPKENRQSPESVIHRFLIEHLPDGISVSEIRYGYKIMNRTDEGFYILIYYYMPSVSEEQEKLLQSAELIPVYIAAGQFDILNTVVYNYPDTLNQNCCILENDSGDGYLFILTKGVLVDYHKISKIQSIDQIEQYLSQIESKFNISIDTILFSGDDDVEDNIRQLTQPIQRINPFKRLIIFKSKSDLMDGSQYTLATGLALQPHYSNLFGIDLLPNDKQTLHKERQNKRKTLQFILGIGGVICLLMFLLHLKLSNLEGKTINSEERLFLMQDRIFAVERAKKERETLEGQIKVMQRLVKERSHASEILEEISRIVPKTVWLSEIRLGEIKRANKTLPDPNHLYISGWSLSENSITQLVANMESSSFYEQVQLEEIRSLNADDVRKINSFLNRPVKYFRIHLVLHEHYIVN